MSQSYVLTDFFFSYDALKAGVGSGNWELRAEGGEEPKKTTARLFVLKGRHCQRKEGRSRVVLCNGS